MKEFTSNIGRVLFAIPFIIFGLLHFKAGQSMVAVVPSYIPGGVFWIYFTGLLLFAAGVSILIKKFISTTLLLLSIYLILMILLIHIPALNNEQSAQMALMSLLKDMALAGAALFMSNHFKN